MKVGGILLIVGVEVSQLHSFAAGHDKSSGLELAFDVVSRDWQWQPAVRADGGVVEAELIGFVFFHGIFLCYQRQRLRQMVLLLRVSRYSLIHATRMARRQASGVMPVR